MSQTVTGLPDMAPGTEVRIVAVDLITVYAAATVENDTLAFSTALEPGREIRLLILSPKATDKDAVNNLDSAPKGSVSPDGGDILLRVDERGSPVSFRSWLLDERGITLVMDAGEGAAGSAKAAGETTGETTEGGADKTSEEVAGTGGKGER